MSLRAIVRTVSVAAPPLDRALLMQVPCLAAHHNAEIKVHRCVSDNIPLQSYYHSMQLSRTPPKDGLKLAADIDYEIRSVQLACCCNRLAINKISIFIKSHAKTAVVVQLRRINGINRAIHYNNKDRNMISTCKSFYTELEAMQKCSTMSLFIQASMNLKCTTQSSLLRIHYRPSHYCKWHANPASCARASLS